MNFVKKYEPKSCPVCMQLLPFDIQRPSFILAMNFTFSFIIVIVAVWIGFARFGCYISCSFDIRHCIFSCTIFFCNGSTIALINFSHFAEKKKILLFLYSVPFFLYLSHSNTSNWPTVSWTFIFVGVFFFFLIK